MVVEEVSTVQLMDIYNVCLGKDVIVDYATNSGRIAYAKGRLISIEGDKLVISGNGRLWIIVVGSIQTFTVKGERNGNGGQAP